MHAFREDTRGRRRKTASDQTVRQPSSLQHRDVRLRDPRRHLRVHPRRPRGADHRPEVGRRPHPAIPAPDHRRTRKPGRERAADQRSDRSRAQLHHPGHLHGARLPRGQLRDAATGPVPDDGEHGQGEPAGQVLQPDARPGRHARPAGGVPQGHDRRRRPRHDRQDARGGRACHGAAGDEGLDDIKKQLADLQDKLSKLSK